MRLASTPLLFSFALAGSALGGTEPNTAAPTTGSETVKPDNTKKNERDRQGATVTPIDQGENKEDLAITKNIRRKVMKGHLSMDAKNVKIITVGGVVTLRGPVKSESEKSTIASDAQSVAGVKQVDNQIEVITKN